VHSPGVVRELLSLFRVNLVNIIIGFCFCSSNHVSVRLVQSRVELPVVVVVVVVDSKLGGLWRGPL
jgi:hypothetical protein